MVRDNVPDTAPNGPLSGGGDTHHLAARLGSVHDTDNAATQSFWWTRQSQPPAIPVLSAVIFDVDGTLADTERDGHRLAFNAAFATHEIDIRWGVEEYGRLLQTTGGRRRIAGDLRARGFGAEADELAEQIHHTKTALFRDWILAGEIMPRPGLLNLVMSLVDQGIRIAVATTGRRAWVEPLLGHLLDDGIVETVVTGDDVVRLKPHPEVYLRALDKLGMSPESGLAIEDSANGLRAATSAGLATVVVTTDYTADQDFTGAAMVRSSYDGIEPLSATNCQRVHRRWWTAAKTPRDDSVRRPWSVS
jgi:HAD superfamily hydrolase (TIGR01509 family)